MPDHTGTRALSGKSIDRRHRPVYGEGMNRITYATKTTAIWLVVILGVALFFIWAPPWAGLVFIGLFIVAVIFVAAMHDYDNGHR